ncbi:MAG: hypothetical protein V6S10_02300 [Candidatus Methanoglobus sp.]
MTPCRKKSRYVVGKVFRPNKSKILALNKTLSEYFKLVKWYLGYNSKSKKFLHEKCYEKAKELFNLNTALIQTARDKAVEILKGFEENREESSILKLKRTSIRFDKRCYSFSKTEPPFQEMVSRSLSGKEPLRRYRDLRRVTLRRSTWTLLASRLRKTSMYRLSRAGR